MAKALLKFGRFSCFEDMPEMQNEIIRVPHPSGLVSITDRDYGTVEADIHKYLEFKFVGHELVHNIEVFVYEFERVV